MNKLIAELQRLYFLHDQLTAEILAKGLAGEAAAGFGLVSPDGRARTMAISFGRAADWDRVAKLYHGVQEDLDLPAPAVSVSGESGYRLWFSLAEPVPAEQAQGFLEALLLKYLADIPPAHLKFHPGLDERSTLDLVPALHGTTGKWSAFIDPAMGAMFVDEPGLEMAPNPDKQADLLAGFESIKAGDFQRVLNALRLPAEPADSLSEQPAGRKRSKLALGGNFSDPKSFLLAVMNDPSASASQRIKAAKALLPYFEKSLRTAKIR